MKQLLIILACILSFTAGYLLKPYNDVPDSAITFTPMVSDTVAQDMLISDTSSMLRHWVKVDTVFYDTTNYDYEKFEPKK